MKGSGTFVVFALAIASGTVPAQQTAVARCPVGIPLTRWESGEKPRNVSVPSPNKQRVFEVRDSGDGKPLITVTSNGKPVTHDIKYEHNASLTWAPDSSSFLTEFTDAGSYDGWQLKLFVFEGERLREYEDIARAAKLNVAEAFPPCVKGSQLNPEDCDLRNFADSLNVFVLAWVAPETLTIAVQVPCSTSYGPNDCRSRVFDISVPSGKVMRAYSQAEARQQYSACFQRQRKRRWR